MWGPRPCGRLQNSFAFFSNQSKLHVSNKESTLEFIVYSNKFYIHSRLIQHRLYRQRVTLGATLSSRFVSLLHLQGASKCYVIRFSQTSASQPSSLEIIVYLGILVTKKCLGSQKILTELTAILLPIRNNYPWYCKKYFAQ